MSGFTPEWLTLREPIDARSRNTELADAVLARFQLRDGVRVVDLGAGTGSNLRATAGLLPERQTWTLVDSDPDLLSAARQSLSRWADRASEKDGTLELQKGRAHIAVSFRKLDLARDLDAALDGEPDLITASALFDLTSVEFMRAFARRAAGNRAAIYAVLNYNGIQRWSPHRPADSQMTGAFHRHQMMDKGFGVAAGPTAAAVLADELRMQGYSVLEGDSPWRLSRDDRMLIEELTRGHALAVSETGAVAPGVISSWVGVARSGAEVGHTDLFATLA